MLLPSLVATNPSHDVRLRVGYFRGAKRSRPGCHRFYRVSVRKVSLRLRPDVLRRENGDAHLGRPHAPHRVLCRQGRPPHQVGDVVVVDARVHSGGTGAVVRCAIDPDRVWRRLVVVRADEDLGHLGQGCLHRRPDPVHVLR